MSSSTEPAAVTKHKRKQGHFDERKQLKKQQRLEKKQDIAALKSNFEQAQKRMEPIKKQSEPAPVVAAAQSKPKASKKPTAQEPPPPVIVKKKQQPPKKKQRKIETVEEEEEDNVVDEHIEYTAPRPKQEPSTAAAASAPSRLDKYRKKLDGAKFRMINESLYNGEALSSQDFNDYHHGFASQVELWPTNPISVICSKLAKRKRCVVGDFGCGNAQLQKELGNKHKVYSFDLVASNANVIECDISKHVPLDDATLDVAVFSLSLMGQDVSSFFVEANRVLRMGGEVFVAEVKSRFVEKGSEDAAVGVSGMKRGLKLFQSQLAQLGFTTTSCDEKSNSMFVLMRFEKTSEVDKLAAERVKMLLNNCPYKRR